MKTRAQQLIAVAIRQRINKVWPVERRLEETMVESLCALLESVHLRAPLRELLRELDARDGAAEGQGNLF
jgi:hypothetical protein